MCFVCLFVRADLGCFAFVGLCACLFAGLLACLSLFCAGVASLLDCFFVVDVCLSVCLSGCLLACLCLFVCLFVFYVFDKICGWQFLYGLFVCVVCIR